MNFILFNPDELRAESVGCYGHPLVQTPNMDRLAGDGVRFEQAHVQHPVCSPSRCCTMTGWYPHVRGHRTLWHLLRPDEPNLLKCLRQAGYEIAWFGKNDLLAESSFAQSVDVLGFPRGALPDKPALRYEFGEPGYYSFLGRPLGGTIDDLTDMACVSAGIEFLRRPHDRPFLLYLPFSLPHPIYSAPQPYHDMYAPSDVPPLRPAGLPNAPDFHALIRRYRNLDEADGELMRKINAVYLGMVSCVDAMLGRLLTAVDEAGLAGDTAVIVYSDHGDWAGDYGLVEKWPSGLDDCMTRVPLLVRLPNGQAGCVAREPVEVMDIMATILELAGVEAKHTHFSRSLVEMLHGQPGHARRAVFAEGGYDLHEPHCLEGKASGARPTRPSRHIYYPKHRQQQERPESVCRSVMARTLTHKLIRRSTGRHELYDLAADPGELCNVYGQQAQEPMQRELERQVLDWLLSTSDSAPWDEDQRGLPPKNWKELGPTP